MNGRPLGVQFKRNSAYVAQEDCFVPTMSAVETLNFTATLTLPKSVTVQERAARIEEVLRIMGLYRSRDTQVTHIRLTSPHVRLHDSMRLMCMSPCAVARLTQSPGHLHDTLRQYASGASTSWPLLLPVLQRRKSPDDTAAASTGAGVLSRCG